jgi:hypothetical protein
MLLRILASFYILLIVINNSTAQDKSGFKFEKITVKDFNLPGPSFDPGAHAIIIADVGISRIIPNTSLGFGYEFEQKIRVRILDNSGLDAGKFELPIYTSNNGGPYESIQQLKGVTYNLEGGQIVETKLESNQVFTENYNRQVKAKKFSMPGLKAGSIFELSYKITSDYLFVLRPWDFQGDYPCNYSEYSVEIPEIYEYIFLLQGYLPFYISDAKQVPKIFYLKDNSTNDRNGLTLDGMLNLRKWVIRNIPSLKEERYTTTLNNHRSKLEFQLNSVRVSSTEVKQIMDTWSKFSEGLMKNEDFGLEIAKVKSSLGNIFDPVIAGANNQLEKARRVYEYIRDNYTCTSRSGLFSSGLKNLLKTKNGNVADLNLLLVAVLQYLDIETYPVVLSTRSNGATNQLYPLVEKFNYVICAAKIGDAEYLLDASNPDLGFGKLGINCINGQARMLTPGTKFLLLSPDSILETKVTFASVSAEKDVLKGSVQTNPGYFESLEQRAEIKKIGINTYKDKLRSAPGNGVVISNIEIDSLQQLDNPIKIRLDLEFKPEEADLIYFNPILLNEYAENPFKSADRNYPVEMPFKIDKSYILNFNLPDGYVVEEMPKSAKIVLNDTDGYYEYLVSVDGATIQLRTRLVLTRATFEPIKYESLREFFGHIVKKQAEQIVLKKSPAKN